jgi:hypothetical protein
MAHKRSVSIRFKMLGLLGMLLLASCAQNGGQIGHSVNLCCPGNYAAYQSYGVSTQEMPGFLEEYVLAEFDGAFQEKGLLRNDRLNDVRVTLSYRHVNLNPDQEQFDPFERRIEEEIVLRYVANIVVDIHESSTNRLVWSGQINRIHSVRPGEYMHEDRARPEFRAAFRELLASYPALAN